MKPVDFGKIKENLNIKVFKKALLSFLFLTQGVYLIGNDKLLNSKGEVILDFGYHHYIYGLSLVLMGAWILMKLLENISKGKNATDNPPTVQKASLSYKPKTNRMPLTLKVTIGYFLFYAFVTEILVFFNWSQWITPLEGKSIGYAVGYLLKGPLLGALFLIAAIGLIQKKAWGRRLALVSIMFAILTDAQSFAWGLTQGREPTSITYFWSATIFLAWNGVWLWLLYDPKVTDVLE